MRVGWTTFTAVNRGCGVPSSLKRAAAGREGDQNSLFANPVISFRPISRPRAVIGCTTTKAAHAFLQLAHVGLLFLVMARRNGMATSFCASLLSFWLCTSRRRAISASTVACSCSSSAYLSAASTSGRSACWRRMASRRSLRRLISFFQLLSCSGFVISVYQCSIVCAAGGDGQRFCRPRLKNYG